MVNNIYGRGMNLNDAIIKQSERINTPEKNQKNGETVNRGPSFKEMLDRQISFSKHANMRTEQRKIEISSKDLSRLGDACNKASEKGIKDALIVMNDSAFIVNAKNKVVITVMDKNEMKDNVFSNIDGAIFI